MYTIEREPEKIVIRDFQGHAVYSAGPDALIAFRLRSSDDLQVAKVRDLNDTNLIIALINAVEIKNFRPE